MNEGFRTGHDAQDELVCCFDFMAWIQFKVKGMSDFIMEKAP